VKILSKKPIVIFSLTTLLLIVSVSLALAQGNVLTDPPKTYTLVQGWYEGRQTFYYDFGANTKATADGQKVIPAPIYVLITGFDADGNPQVVEGQRNIVDVIPGDPGYSDLWQVTFVTVPEDYAANTFTSADDVLNSGFEMTVPGVLVNCPIVPLNSELAEGGAPLVQGWYKGQEVHYFDFGPNIEEAAPIYAFITGFDADSNPQFVEGQANVIGVIPGDAGYSAFWNVNLVTVPADYQANSITSVDEVLTAGYDIAPAGLLVNCPVLRTDEAGATSMAAEELPTTGGVKPDLSPWVLITGAGVLGFGLFLWTRSSGKTQKT
jgi:hypothetical protein